MLFFGTHWCRKGKRLFIVRHNEKLAIFQVISFIFIKIPITSKFIAFVCHESGGTSLLYASQHQLLISAGRKGVVCLWDLRQRTLRHKFSAHESSIAVKWYAYTLVIIVFVYYLLYLYYLFQYSMALDPNEEFFATGSADGDIKVIFIWLHLSNLIIIIIIP